VLAVCAPEKNYPVSGDAPPLPPLPPVPVPRPNTEVSTEMSPLCEVGWPEVRWLRAAGDTSPPTSFILFEFSTRRFRRSSDEEEAFASRVLSSADGRRDENIQ
jgi:hypothetical protein